MDEEYKANIQNGTWKLVKREPRMNVIGSTWNYKMKTDQDGKPIKYKSRLYAQGFKQKYGIDYDEIFAPVADISTIRLLAALAASNSLIIYQADIATAYLNVEGDEEINMDQPTGYEVLSEDGDELVCSLKSAIYGLEQSGRKWWSTLHNHIISMDLKQSVNDVCLYCLKNDEGFAYMAIYVDDILLACSSSDLRTRVFNQLQQKFKPKIIGPATWMLSLHFTHYPGKITIDQTTYIESVLKQYGMDRSNAACAPMAATNLTDPGDIEYLPEKEHNLYRSIIGSLMYITTSTRPDISFAVGELGRFTHRPTKSA